VIRARVFIAESYANCDENRKQASDKASSFSFIPGLIVASFMRGSKSFFHASKTSGSTEARSSLSACFFVRSHIPLPQIIGTGAAAAGGMATANCQPAKKFAIAFATAEAVLGMTPLAPRVKKFVSNGVNKPGVAGPPGIGIGGGVATAGGSTAKTEDEQSRVSAVSIAVAAERAVPPGTDNVAIGPVVVPGTKTGLGAASYPVTRALDQKDSISRQVST
jgi:hypothetical protein